MTYISGFASFSFQMNIAIYSNKKITNGFFDEWIMKYFYWVTSEPNGPIYFNTWEKSGYVQLAVSWLHIPKFTITTSVLEVHWQTVAGGKDIFTLKELYSAKSDHVSIIALTFVNTGI